MHLGRRVNHTLLGAGIVGARASRAIASAIRFAIEPPPLRLPLNPLHPIASASQRTTVRSTVTALGAERQAVTFWLSTEA